MVSQLSIPRTLRRKTILRKVWMFFDGSRHIFVDKLFPGSETPTIFVGAQDDRMDINIMVQIILDSTNSIQNQHSHPSGPKEYGFPF